MNNVQFGVEKLGDVVILLLPMEELDASNSAEFKRDIGPLFEERTKVVLNMSHLRFVDSSGLGALLSCLRMAIARGGSLKLCEMAPQVRSLFDLVRMNRIFDIYGTQAEAVSA